MRCETDPSLVTVAAAWMAFWSNSRAGKSCVMGVRVCAETLEIRPSHRHLIAHSLSAAMLQQEARLPAPLKADATTTVRFARTKPEAGD